MRQLYCIVLILLTCSLVTSCSSKTTKRAGGDGAPSSNPADPTHSGPPAHAEWEMTFRDEFNGDSLDWDVWVSAANTRNESLGRWPENNVVKDGILRQVTRREDPPRGERPWSSAHIWTRDFTQQYGYFEARMRYAPYHNNAFWLWRPSQRFEERPHFEIDINEGHTPRELAMTLHFFVYPEGETLGELYSTNKVWDAPMDLDDSFHVYGLEWTKDELIWYFDGKPVRRLKNPIAFAPTDVRFSTVPHLDRMRREGVPVETIDGASMDIDWVRVWRKVRDVRQPANMPKLERFDIPKPAHPEPRIETGGERQAIFNEDFETADRKGLPEGWTAAGKSPSVAPDVAEGERPQHRPDNSLLRLDPGDYAYRMFDRPVKDRMEVSFDLWAPARKPGLLFVTLGRFDESDKNAREQSYFQGDIGPYIFWKRHYINEYTQPKKWQPVAKRPGDNKWHRVRIVMDIDRGIFDLFVDDKKTWTGSGDFRHRPDAARGIGLRHRGGGGPVFIDNVEVVGIRTD